MKSSNLLKTSLLALLVLTSCNGKDNNQTTQGGLTIIDIDNPQTTDNPPVEQLVDTAFVVQLKGDDLLIKSINGLRKCGDRLFVEDSPYSSTEPLKIFDSNGNYISSIHKGGGPGEVDNYSGCFFDEVRQELFVLDYNRLSIFDKNGVFKEQTDYKFMFDEMVRLADEYVLYVSTYHMDSTKTQVIVTDTAFNVLHRFMPYEGEPLKFEIKSKLNVLTLTGNHVTVENDTVYVYENSRFEPRYYFNYANRFDPRKIAVNSSIIDMGSNNGYLQAFYENSTSVFLMLNSFDAQDVKVTVYDIKSGKYYVYPYKTDRQGDDVKVNCPFFQRAKWVCDDYFVAPLDDQVIEQKSEIMPFISEEDKKIVEDFNSDDNPILVFYKFKEF
ncbi:MAG: hypothetical protein J6Y82_04770 [Bacteroidales bacterium]|nr:hypothetical protein [Bacteroidales bacterium]